MFNNSTSIHKTNSYLSSQTIEHDIMALEIQVLAWDRGKYVAGLNLIMASLDLHRQYRYKQIITKILQTFASA
jgi:hypothetical protein